MSSTIDRIRIAIGEHGYTVLETADYDAMIFELAKLKGLERAVRTMATADCAVRELLTTLDQ
jgi:hypothetical protein